MAITLFEYQVLYLLLHFLKFLLDLLRQVPCVVFSDLASACYSASKTAKSQHDILTCISYQSFQIFYIHTHTPTMFFFYFVTILFIPFFPSSTSSFFCLYQFFFLVLTCHYYLFHNMFGVFVYQYCVIRVLLCLITSTFVLYKKKNISVDCHFIAIFFFLKLLPITT